jgi:hypothetical protein
MITNHSRDGGPAVVFRDVAKVSAGGFALRASDAIVLAAWTVGLATVAMLRWRREASVTA